VAKPFQDFEVILQITRQAKFTVEARTSEEAEDIAEAYFQDGELGEDVEPAEITPIDAYPIDNDPLGE
jgi:hypothetical protein